MRVTGTIGGSVGVALLVAAVSSLWAPGATSTDQAPKMRSPNAYDYFVAAGKMVKDDSKVSEALGDDNDPTVRQATPAEKATLLNKNRAVLKKLREGLRYPYLEPPERSIEHTFPYLHSYRSLGQVLRLEGQARAARGDWRGAMESDLDAIRLGVAVSHGATIIGSDISMTIQGMGRRDLWPAVEKFSATDATRTARTLEALAEREVPPWKVLTEEKLAWLAMLHEVFQDPAKMRVFLGLPGSDDSGGPAVRAMMAKYDERTVLTNYNAYIDRVISNARMPYAAKLDDPPNPADPISLQGAMPFHNYFYVAARHQALSRLLTVTFAPTDQNPAEYYPHPE